MTQVQLINKAAQAAHDAESWNSPSLSPVRRRDALALLKLARRLNGRGV